MIDRVEIAVKAGNGGDGAVSFRREKYVPYGGPDGGDGGDGGDVIFVADNGITALDAYKSKKVYRAAKGESGGGKKKSGKRGADLVLVVPVGTVILEREKTLADLDAPGKRYVAARGGRGGLGNVHFASSTNQAPRLAQKGEVGEEKALVLDLRLIADVGIVGYPNAGKSTLLSAISAAHPKVAGYPFTTIEPELGVVRVDSKSFIAAEIPGLVEDAHLGKGLGLDFLRHALRTRMLVHLIDGTAAAPVEDMRKINEELRLFDASLAAKPQLVAVNKIDLPPVRERMAQLRQELQQAGAKPFFISAATGEGVAALVAEAARLLDQLAASRVPEKEVPVKVFRPQPRRATYRVARAADGFVIVSPELERVADRVDLSDPEVMRQFLGLLGRAGASRALERAGIKPGDKVRLGKAEWTW